MPTSAPAIVPATCVIARVVIEPTYGTLIILSTVRIAQLGCSRRKTSAIYKASKAARPNLIPDRTLRSPSRSWSAQCQCLSDLAERSTKELWATDFAWASTSIMLGIPLFPVREFTCLLVHVLLAQEVFSALQYAHPWASSPRIRSDQFATEPVGVPLLVCAPRSAGEGDPNR